MPCIGFVYNGENRTFKEVLDREKRLEGNGSLPYPLLALIAAQVSKDHYELSVTTCLYCLRKAFIQNRMNYFIDPSAALQMTYGTELHHAIELCEYNEWQKEVTVEKEIRGVVIKGSVDALFEDEEGLHLVDFKFTGSQKSNINTDFGVQRYIKQVHMYSYLYGLDKIKRATILIMPTSQKNANIMSIEVSLDEEEVMDSVNYIVDRALILQEAYKTGTLPPFDKKDCIPNFCASSIQKLCKGDINE